VDKYNGGPAPEKLRHPSVDNPGTPPVARLAAAGPYVINLSASNTPFSMPAIALLNWDHLHIYQIQRVEDGRLRFRLRLGPIMSELEADVTVVAVRQSYPFALTATAGADDLLAIAAAAALVGHRTTKPFVKFATGVPAGAPANAQVRRAPHADRDSVNNSVTAPPAGTAVRPSTIVASGPGAHPRIQESPPATGLVADMQPVITTPPSRRPAAPATQAVKPVMVEESQPTRSGAPTLRDCTVGSTSKSVGRHPQIRPDPLLAVHSTQTLCALMPIDLGEDQLSKWLVIQLAVADTAFHPEDVLNLDIFNEFSLYSTIGVDRGRVLHALRLGFFTEPSAAHTVAAYVRQYFDASVVKRVSIAERERFVEGRVVARKSGEATGVYEVIELSTPPLVPATKLSILSKSVSRRDPEDQSPRPRSKSVLKR